MAGGIVQNSNSKLNTSYTASGGGSGGANKALQKAQNRVENMEMAYVPTNPNPLNIEIGLSGSSHRVLDEDDEIGDVQINDNFAIGIPSAQQHVAATAAAQAN